MSQSPDTQTFTKVDPFDFGAPTAPLPQAQPATPEPVVAQAPVDTPAPVAEAPATPAVIADPVADALAAMEAASAAPTQWSDEARALFKQEFGADDPGTFKTEYSALREQFELIRTEKETLSALKADLDRLSPAMLRAIELGREGKDPVGYLRSLPDGVFHNKPAAELTDRQLIDTYAKGKITDDQWSKLNDPDTDSEVVEVIKEKISHYRDICADKHETERGRVTSELQSAQQAQAQAFEQFQKGVASTLSHAKNDPFAKAFVDKGHADEMSQPGKFLSRFLESDGVTPKPEALTMILKAERFDRAVQVAKESAYRKGKEDGVLEATSKQPSTPQARRDAATPPQQHQRSADATVLDSIERGIGG